MVYLASTNVPVLVRKLPEPMHSSRTRAVGVAVSALATVAALLAPAPAFAATADTSQTFSATGGVQTWTVPTGVTEIYVDLAGAQGGASYGLGGGGAELTGTLSVTPGETLNIIAGAQGGAGQQYFTGAGGGGGSFIFTSADRAGVLAAAGGGGGASSSTGASAASLTTSGTNGGSGGGAGGTDGNGGGAGTASSPYVATTPAAGGGGVSSGAGGFGGGGAGGTPAGGGGGGYSGGGGGSFSIDGGNGGGGGGGSYFSGALTGSVANRSGNGFVTIYYPAHLTAITPAVGLPGDSLTIRGSGLADATVTIGGVAATVTSSRDTALVVTVPAQTLVSTGAVTVSVTTAGGVTLPAVGAFGYVPPPTVNVVTPASIARGSAPTVTITGTRFTAATAVYFGATAATSFTVTSDTSITATVPATLPAGTVNTTVVAKSGTSTTSPWDELTVNEYPDMTLTPGTLANGQVGVAYSEQLSTAGGTSPYTYSIASGALPAGLTLTAESGALTGTPTSNGSFSFAVTARDQYGNTTSESYSVDVRVAAATITGVSPDGGPTDGDTDIVITGTNFAGATEVTIGSTPVVSFTVVSPTRITAVTAAGPAGTHAVRVTTPGGTTTSPADVRFRYAAEPTVTAVGPTSGAILGGTSVTITGTGFTGATAVDFGRFAATSYTVDSDTTITAVTPASAAGAVHVRVTTVGGVSATGTADQFTFDPLAIPVTPTVPPSVTPAQTVPPQGNPAQGKSTQGKLAQTGADAEALFPLAGGLLFAGLIAGGVALLGRRRREAL